MRSHAAWHPAYRWVCRDVLGDRDQVAAGEAAPPGVPAEWIVRMSRELALEALPITQAHVVRVADLPDHHGDPFDRLLIAQAQVESIPIVTADRSFAHYDVELIPAR